MQSSNWHDDIDGMPRIYGGKVNSKAGSPDNTFDESLDQSMDFTDEQKEKIIIPAINPMNKGRLIQIFP